MTRWIAAIAAAVSLLVLLGGMVRAETDSATTAGVSLVFWGVAGLVVAGGGAGLVELAARRASVPPRPAPRSSTGPRAR